MTHVAFETAALKPGGVGASLASLRAAFANWLLYRRTLADLTALPDSMLADLGIARVDLRTVSHKAVYGR